MCLCAWYEPYCDECRPVEQLEPERNWNDYVQFVVLIVGPSIDPAISEVLDGLAEDNREWMANLLDAAFEESDEP